MPDIAPIRMKIVLSTSASRLLFRFPFRIAHGERTGTDVVFVRALCHGYQTFGEATLPPYLDDNIESVLGFFNSPLLEQIDLSNDPEVVFDEIDQKYFGALPAKAALDMALWRLKAISNGKTLHELFGADINQKVPHSYTIGVCDKVEMGKKIEFGLQSGFSFFKLKLTGANDKQMLSDYAALSKLPFAVDANQSWMNLDDSIDLSLMLEQLGCVLIEQPFPKDDFQKTYGLKNRISIPLIADEACQRLGDIDKLQESFDGVNIKLQKCGGLTEAFRMIKKARELDMKILIGCMSESSVGCDAAEALAPFCDWADLDGPFLISNNDAVLFAKF